MRFTHENDTSKEVPSFPDSFREKKDPCCRSRIPSVLIRGKDRCKLVSRMYSTYLYDLTRGQVKQLLRRRQEVDDVMDDP